MNKLIPTSPELLSSIGDFLVRQDLTNHSVTIYLKDWRTWDVDTQQNFLSPNIIHFVDCSGSIVGIKVLQ